MALYSNTYKFVILVNDFRFCLFFFLRQFFCFALAILGNSRLGFSICTTSPCAVLPYSLVKQIHDTHSLK